MQGCRGILTGQHGFPITDGMARLFAWTIYKLNDTLHRTTSKQFY